MKPIRTAIFGTGFMGRVHLEALRRLRIVEVVAIAGRNADAARRLGAGFSIPTIVTDYREVLRDPAIDAVHICTPERAALSHGQGGARKPASMCSAKSRWRRAWRRPKNSLPWPRRRDCATAICHNLRYYPMVQQMRRMREAGELGEILVVQGTYSRTGCSTTPTGTGASTQRPAAPRAAWPISARTGSTWLSMLPGCASLRSVPICRPSTRRASSRNSRSKPLPTSCSDRRTTSKRAVDTEDFGAVIFRMGARARGSVTASQVSAGRKNRLSIEIYGTKILRRLGPGTSRRTLARPSR